MCLKIEEGALFIADAHENANRKGFWEFLEKVHSKEIPTSQLFIMGDMFDLLVGKVDFTCIKYKKYIQLLESIAQKIPVFYFEGNHDFCLKTLFEHVHVIPIQKQPMQFVLPNGKHALLLHGDKYGSLMHNLYTRCIRSSFVLSGLNQVDKLVSNAIARTIEKNQQKKNICKQIEDFKTIIHDKIPRYKSKKADYILEGHYHQNRQFHFDSLNYINFSSFACNQSFFIVKCSQKAEFAQMKLRGYNV